MNAILEPATDTRHEFRPRRVSFDYSATPSHWIPDDPHTTHIANVLHLLLPAGERWFGEVCRKALPLIDDPAMARDVKAFIGQEATHARAHTVVLDHLEAHGIDHSGYTQIVEWAFSKVPARDAPAWLPGPIRNYLTRRYLLDQLATVAAIEHFTAVLGWWILMSRGMDDSGADAEMTNLLRWHGAEEVEHRSVAFDVYRALGGGELRRRVWMLVTAVGFFAVWTAGTDHLIRHDPKLHGRVSIPKFIRAGRKGRLPTMGMLAGSVPRYLRRDYHPSDEGRTEVAVAYLDSARLGDQAA